jgi:hypothetical protein
MLIMKLLIAATSLFAIFALSACAVGPVADSSASRSEPQNASPVASATSPWINDQNFIAPAL